MDGNGLEANCIACCRRIYRETADGQMTVVRARHEYVPGVGVEFVCDDRQPATFSEIEG